VYWIRSILLAGVGLLFATAVQAAGAGVYLEYGRAGGEVYFDDGLPDAEYDTNKFGVGFVFDTNVAKNSLFNYRLSLGYRHSERDYEMLYPVYSGAEEDFHGFTMNHTFGFGLYRGPALRLWLGPAIRLGVDVIDEHDSSLDAWDLSIGAGPQLGVNVHAGDYLSFSISAAYQYLYVARIERHENPFGDDDLDGLNGTQHLGTLNVSFLFRSKGDRYKPRKKE
jgi:hypothetical protein